MDKNQIRDWFAALPVDVAESIKLEFAVSIDKAIKDAKLTRKEIAERLKTSPAWVTKVLRGDINLTIDSMVKLSAAVGQSVEIRLIKQAVVSNAKLVSHTEFLNYGEARAKKGAFEIDMGAFRGAVICNDSEYLNAA